MLRRSFLALAAASPLLGCRRDRRRIRVGSKNFSESVLLGEIVAQQLERRGLEVDRKPNLGGTFVCHQAMVRGDLDVYVEYTGTALVAVLKDDRKLTDPAQVRAAVVDAWPARFGAIVLPPLGFDDTFAILVRRRDAERLALSRISDLAAHAPKMRPGFGYEFVERADGYEAFRAAYGLSFATAPATMELSLTYRALADEKVDVIAGNSTDGLIDKLGLVQLEDDKRFFPPYEAVPIARKAALDAHPKLRDALSALSGTIDASRMRALNRAVDVDGRPVAEVARGFLDTKS